MDSRTKGVVVRTQKLMHHMRCLTEPATCYISAPINCTCTLHSICWLKDSASGKRYGIRWIGVGQIQDQHLAQFMEDSCELLHTNAQCHKTKRQKCGYINFRNVYRVPGKKKYLVQSRDSCCFQESRVAKQCLDAAKFTGRQYIYYRWYNLPPWLHSRN